jgi:hypothetical protein
MDTTLGNDYKLQRLITLNSSVLTSFTTTVQDTFPVYTPVNAIQINDTLFLNQDFVVPLTNITYYDEVECIISPNPPAIFPIIPKKYKSPVNQLTFTAAELSVFTPNQLIYCRLILKKYSTQQIGGKNFRFDICSFNDFYMIVQ